MKVLITFADKLPVEVECCGWGVADSGVLALYRDIDRTSVMFRAYSNWTDVEVVDE